MLFFLLSSIIFTRILCTWGSNTGSAIFYSKHTRSGCWNEEDIAKLRARRLFQQIIPSPITPQRVNSKYIRDTLRYFRHALHTVEKDEDKKTAAILKESLADTIGAHLTSEVLPTARFAYYAGYVPYVRVRELHDFYDNIKEKLNTQGLGWKKPGSIPEWANLTVAKILIGDGKYFHPCDPLIIKRDSSSCIHLSSPQFDDENEPSALALPLKTGGFVSLTSPLSKNVLLKYYTTASRCILNNSPAKCRHADFVNFNNDMWHWMKRNVAPHLVDEKLYAAYGGVLRIAAGVQSYGKGLATRNIYDLNSDGATKWHPWKTIKDTYFYVDIDRTPYLYVGIVVLAAISIYLMQICYNYILGNEDGCTCKGRPEETLTRDVAYGDVETNIPAMLPSHQSAVFYTEQKRAQRSHSKKSSSLGSMRPRTVYDLNENIQKLMDVIISDTEDTDTSVRSESVDEDETMNGSNQSKRSTSPPKIDTDVSHVQLSTSSKNLSRTLYSTSSVSRSEHTYRQRVTDSNLSGSTSSEESMSSTMSKSQCRKSKSSRDLARVKRVVSKHSVRQSTSGTELDYTSFTTPLSRQQV